MVSTRLLAFTVGITLIVATSVGWRRYRVDAPLRPDLLLSLLGSSTYLLAVVGFDGAFGLIRDPGVAPGLARTVQTLLHVLSLAAYAGACWYWWRD